MYSFHSFFKITAYSESNVVLFRSYLVAVTSEVALFYIGSSSSTCGNTNSCAF